MKHMILKHIIQNRLGSPFLSDIEKSMSEHTKKELERKYIAVDDLVKLNKDKGTSAVLKWLLEEVRKSPVILKNKIKED